MSQVTPQVVSWQRMTLAVAAGVAAAVAPALAVMLLWDVLSFPHEVQAAWLLVSFTQGVVCLLISGAIAPRGVALPTVLLTTLVRPVCEWAYVAPIYARLGVGVLHLPPGTSAANMLAGAAAVALSATLTMWALRRGRRTVVVLTAYALLVVLWCGSWWYYRTLNELNPLCLEPQVISYLQKNVLQNVGPAEWFSAWLSPFPPKEFMLVRKHSRRADGASLSIILNRIPRARFGEELQLAELTFPESRSDKVATFTVFLRHLPNPQPDRPLAPAQLTKLGWLRPELSQRLVPDPSAAGEYTASLGAAMVIRCKMVGDEAIVSFFGTYCPGERGAAGEEPR